MNGRIESNGKTVLVTGAAGYIGSHCVVTLQEAGYDVIALDNFANSVADGSDGSIALKRVEKITGKPVLFYKCDLLDTASLEKIFQNVMHHIRSMHLKNRFVELFCVFVLFGFVFQLASNRFGDSFCRNESGRRIDAESDAVLQK